MHHSLAYKGFILLLLLLLMHFSASAQQQLHLSQYMMNPYILNPAVGGTEADLDLRTGYRHQWTNFPGAPKTLYLTGNARFRVLRKPDPLRKVTAFHSAGVAVYQDEAGPIKRISALLSYNYNIPLSQNLNMSVGVSAGIIDLNLDYSMLEFDQEGEVFDYSSSLKPDGNIGIWLYNRNFFLGLSANQIFQNKINFFKDRAGKEDVSQLRTHFYLTNGYNIPLGYARGRGIAHDYYLVPSFLVKYGGIGKPSIDLNAKIKMRELLWLGASYRKGDALAFMGGLTLLNKGIHWLEAGYSYDRTTSAIKSASYGSHELIIIYKIKGKTGILCPENFW